MASKRKKRSTSVARVNNSVTRRGSATRLSGNRMLDDAKQAGLIIVGIIAGKQVAALFNKATNTVSGIMGVDGTEIKSYLTPILTTLLGLGVHQLVKNPYFKAVGLGVATYGGIQVVQKITGKTYLAGLGDGDTMTPAYQSLPQIGEPMPNPLLMNFTEGFENQEDITSGVQGTSMGEVGEVGNTPEFSFVAGQDDITAGVDGYDDEFAGYDDEFAGVGEDEVSISA